MFTGDISIYIRDSLIIQLLLDKETGVTDVLSNAENSEIIMHTIIYTRTQATQHVNTYPF